MAYATFSDDLGPALPSPLITASTGDTDCDDEGACSHTPQHLMRAVITPAVDAWQQSHHHGHPHRPLLLTRLGNDDADRCRDNDDAKC